MTDDLMLGKHWAEVRRTTKLSRADFAQRVGLTPGAVWRIEARGRFKPGELKKLTAVFGEAQADAMLAQTIADMTAPVSVLVPPTPLGTPVVPAKSSKVFTPLASLDDDELPGWSMMWFDAAPDANVAYPWPDPADLTWVAPPATETGHVVVFDPGTAADTPVPVELVLPPPTPYQLSELDGITRISNSEIQTFKRCRRKWMLTYYRRLHLRTGSPVGVSMIGDRIHRALAQWYVADAAQRVDPRDAIERVIAHDWAVVTDSFAAQDEDVPLSLETRFRDESDLERIMVEGYVQWLAETGFDSDFQVVGSEQYLEVDLPGFENVRLVARLDARVRRVSDGVRMFIDHKTVGDLTSPVKTLNINEQMLFYHLIENLLLDDQRCAGAVFNMLRRVKRTGSANPPFYRRVEVYHNAVQIENFLTRTRGTVAEMLRLRAALDAGEDHRLVAYPTPSGDCSWSCDFLPVDAMMDDGSRFEDAINDLFAVGDPTAYYART